MTGRLSALLARGGSVVSRGETIGPMLDNYHAKNGDTAIVVAYALGGAYIGITAGDANAQIRITPDQAREIARTLTYLADTNTTETR